MSGAAGGGEPDGSVGDRTIVVGAAATRPNRPPLPRAGDRLMASGGGENQPTLHVLSAASVNKYPIQPNVYVVSLGNARDQSDIYIQDPDISGKQVVIIKIGGEWMFLDCGTTDCVWFNGVQKRQHIAPMNGRVVIRCGRKYIVFVSNYDPHQETATVRLKRELLMPEKYKEGDLPIGAVTVTARGRKIKTTKRPVILGKEIDGCDLTLVGDVRPFHCQIVWREDGIYAEPLGDFPIVVGKEAVTVATPLKDGSSIKIGEDEVRIHFEGDVAGRAAALNDPKLLAYKDFTLTALANSESNSIDIESGLKGFKLGHAIVIGRSETCDITIPDSACSREHAQLIPNDKSFILIDNYSANGTFVNGERITKMRVRAGDIVEFGNSYFLVHYT
jgi:hypothetical protein